MHRFVAGLALLCALHGCSKETASPSNGENGPGSVELRLEVLGSASEAIISAQEAFVTSATVLERATATHAASLAPGDLDAARVAWKDAMHDWQRLEVMQVGPAGLMSDVIGGEGLRDEIYSWPLVNPCRVDQETLNELAADLSALSAAPVNVRGLDALEYLLFVPSAENACPPNLEINSGGLWETLDEPTIAARRARYAAAAATDVRTRAEGLRDLWTIGGGNFAGRFADPRNGDLYGTTREALNGLSDAMFYVEKEVKDMKIAPAAGISGCLDASCPEFLESRWAHVSVDNIKANLEAFGTLYRGASASKAGFDDLLVSIGAEDVDAEVEAALVAALEAAEAVDQTPEAITRDPAPLRNLHDKTNDLGIVLKTRFVTVLDLDLPRRAEGDND